MVLSGPRPQRGKNPSRNGSLAELKKQRLEFEEAEEVGNRISEGWDLERKRALEIGIGIPRVFA